jgi:glucose-6-phosphate isomerase
MSSISQKLHLELSDLADKDQKHGIRSKFKESTNRATDFGFDHGGLYFDFSKTHISEKLIDIYQRYSNDIGFNAQRLKFLSGERINNSEDRSVLHALLRDETNQGIPMSEPATLQQAADSKLQFKTQYQHIQSQLSKRSVPIRDIIHVGIGGSSLGTQLVFEALKEIGSSISVHFIGNIDAHLLSDVFSKCSVESTLVIGVSKTFTTAETLQNLDSIADWFKSNGTDNPLEHFYGVTANPEKAIEYGILKDNAVSFPNWGGGRYSVWSSVSLSASLVIGWEKFEEFLSGAASIDQHFYTQELGKNVCFIAAMLDHYYINYMNVSSKAIFAYDYRLRSLVDYLQQLETESNGKDRQRNGEPVDQKTSPVVWGGVGTDVQHSVFQMLHQGTAIIPSEFILVKTPDHNLLDHHQELLANGLAQTAALLSGQDYDTVSQIHKDENLSELTKKAKIFSGNRPSSTLLLDRLTAANLGALLAFYEHRTYCFGVFTNINSYDQMGVELGKRLATQVKPLLDASGMEEKGQAQKSADDFDQSTLNLLSRVVN